jgi:hypothetical protein
MNIKSSMYKMLHDCLSEDYELNNNFLTDKWKDLSVAKDLLLRIYHKCHVMKSIKCHYLAI